MNNNKIKKYIVIGILFLLIPIFILIIKNTSAATSTEYSRETLQDYIVSTALSYYNNHEYSDYGQYSMDNTNGDFANSIYFRNMNNSPEAVSRANQFYIDCSSFSAMVYMKTLNYDFGNYIEDFTTIKERKEYTTKYNVIKKFSISDSRSDGDNYRYAYKHLGKGMNTVDYAQIGYKESGKKTEGTEYKNNSSTNTNLTVYYYEVTGNETTTRKNEIKNNIKSVLRKGDIVVYRTQNAEKKPVGHAMLYVGDAIHSGTGFINSTGSDFDPNSTDENGFIKLGIDTYSIQYDILSKLTDHMFVTEDGKKSISFTVLRPINKFCDGNNCTVSNTDISPNAKARDLFKNLKIEQYANEKKTYKTTDGTTKTTSKVITKYNQVNYNDEITYNLSLKNVSKLEFCKENGAWSTKSGCEGKGYKWISSDRAEITYKDLTITANVPDPDNTEYVSCNNNCTPNESKTKITWNVSQISPTDGEKTYSYTVKMKKSTTITNDGFTITNNVTNDGTTTTYKLQMEPLETRVKPTYNGINIDIMKNKVSSMSSNDYTGLYNIKSLYKKAYDINLDDIITKDNVLNALFVKKIDSKNTTNFRRKTSTEISEMTNETYKTISNMLVPGFYGGRILRANDKEDRINYYSAYNFEFGDIILTFDSDDLTLKSYMYYGKDSSGNSVIATFENGIKKEYTSTTTKTCSRLIQEFKAYGLFVVLRPSRVYGTTVLYNYKGADKTYDTSYIAYNTYKNLVIPEKNGYNVTLNYNKTVSSSYAKKLTNENKFDGWYSDSSFDDDSKVNNTSKLVKDSAHTLYAKWTPSSVKLPNPTVENSTFKGWYSDSSLTTFVGNGNSTITPTKDMTLYAKWIDDPIISFETNGGKWQDNSTSTLKKQVKYNETFYFSSLPSITKTNTYGVCSFEGWQRKDTDNVYKSYITPTANRDYIASWDCPTSEDTSKVKYNANGGEGVPTSQTKKYNEALTLSSTKPTREGYTFKNWNTKADGSGTSFSSGANYTKNEDLTLYAQWNANNYTIEYYLGNNTSTQGVTKIGTTTCTYNNNCNLKNWADFNKEIPFSSKGWTFAGWTTEENDTEIKYANKKEVKNLTSEKNSIVKLYAVFKRNISFYSGTKDNQKIEIAEQFYNPSCLDSKNYTRVNFPTEPAEINSEWTYQGYTVSGEKTSTATTYKEYLTRNPSYEPKLYAIYSRNISVNYNANGGTGTMETTEGVQYYNSNGVIEEVNISTLPNDFENIGHNLKFWGTTSTATNGVLPESTITFDNDINESSSITLYAIWENEKYKVEYNANGGADTPSSQEKEYNHDIKLSEDTPSKKGYTFKNWNTTEDGTGTSYESGSIYTSNENIILYAQWEVNNEERIYNAITENNIDYLTNIMPKTNITDYIYNMKLGTDYTTKIYNKNNIELSKDSIIGTGYITEIYQNDELINRYINIVKRDSSCDGLINAMDIVEIANIITKKNNASREVMIASDATDDNKVNVMDIVEIANYILNQKNK